MPEITQPPYHAGISGAPIASKCFNGERLSGFRADARVHGMTHSGTPLARQTWYTNRPSCDSRRSHGAVFVFVSTTPELFAAERCHVRQSGTCGPQRTPLRQLAVYRKQGMTIASTKKVVFRQIRDLAATLAVLVVLFGMLMAINPRVRERFGEMTMSVQGGRDVNASLGPVSNAAYAAVSIGSDYAADNPILFSFLVVAVVLFMLMLRS
jgi:hypothetical protein